MSRKDLMLGIATLSSCLSGCDLAQVEQLRSLNGPEDSAMAVLG